MKSGASESRGKQLLHSARKYLTDWAIAGAIITLTGFAPEHWIADLLSHLAIPESIRHGWLQAFDIRIGLVAVGVAIIAWDVLRRSRLQKQEVLPNSTLEHVQSPDQSDGDEKQPHATETAALALPDKPSIAVLPFQNMSGDPEQEYFIDGITEDIITELSRFHSLFVIARNSSFSYKGKSPDVRQVGKELGVRYVLEGSIRRAGERIRVTAQLIDTLTGSHIWAEKYDRMLEDVFEVQEEVTRSIVAAIAPQIDAAEREKARRRRPENLSAYEIAVRADAHAWEATLKQDRALGDQATREAKEALAIDPGSILSMLVLANVNLRKVIFRTTDNLDAAWHEGLAYAEKAIELDRSDSRGYQIKAAIFVFSLDGGSIEDALAAARRAHELNPNDLFAMHTLGYAEIAAGNPARGKELLLQALRVSPRDPLQFIIYHNLSQAHYLERDYGKALEYGLLGAREAPHYPMLPISIALAYVGLKEIQKARASFETARRLAPAHAQARLDGTSTYFRKSEHRQKQTRFLRVAAGLDDPSAADAYR